MIFKRTKNKYNNIKVERDGRKFDSKGEMSRFYVLQMQEKAGEISNLRTQVRYTFPAIYPITKTGKIVYPESKRAVTYVADFVYIENGKEVVEDFKGKRERDRVYLLKKALMLSLNGIEIKET